MKKFETLSCTISLRAGDQNVSKAASMPFFVHNTSDVSTQNRSYFWQEPPPMCLPSVYLMSSHVTKSPRRSPSVFANCKWSNARNGNSLGKRLSLPHSQTHWLNILMYHRWILVNTFGFEDRYCSTCIFSHTHSHKVQFVKLVKTMASQNTVGVYALSSVVGTTVQ